MTNHIGVVYTENKIELLRSIGPSVTCDQNQIGQQCDRSHKSGLLQSRN